MAWRKTTRVGAILLLSLFVITACSRKPAVEGVDASNSVSQALPFERSPNRQGISPTTAIPFDGVPAGTTLKVHLRFPLSSAYSRTGEPFDAVLDEGVVVKGKLLVARGTPVTGRVVVAKPSDGLQNPGYLRLTLSQIDFQGKQQPIQTSSIFRKGGTPTGTGPEFPSAEPSDPTPATSPRNVGQPDVEVSPDRRLAFRLKGNLPNQS